MKKSILHALPIMICLLLPVTAISQQSMNAGGGDASTTSGNISYSIGQVFSSASEGTGGSVSEGVQQTYDVTEVYINNKVFIPQILCQVYPNPAQDRIQLEIDEEELSGYHYTLFTNDGKLLDQGDILSTTCIINLNNYKPASYLLEITKNNHQLKTFQIIKK